ncbi:MAG: hypothetical protein ABWY12_02305 [Burkholderiales bacterium]
MGSENSEAGSTGLIYRVAVTRSLRWIVVRGCAVALATLAATTLVGRANAFVYWTESAIGTTGRANLDSSGVNMTFIKGLDRPQGMAIDGAHIYWVTGLGSIGRANLDGTGVKDSFIIGALGAQAVAVDGSHVYWTISGPNGDRIARANLDANLDGTGVNQFFLFAGKPERIAVDSAHVWWTNGAPLYSIGRANLDGTGVSQSFIAALSTPAGVAVNALATPSPGPGATPPTITGLVADVQGLGWPRGTEDSLLAKLGAAQRNLDAGGLQAACGSLGAYINEVRAQTDKRLDGDQAADLVADATVIRELLGCRAD